LPSKKASLINFRQPPKPPSLDEFVDKDPGIPTPSLPDPPPRPDPVIQPERHNMTLAIKKTLHKGLKIHASRVEKRLQYLMEDALEAYLDKHWPDWRQEV
jgi:hypothetical protein